MLRSVLALVFCLITSWANAGWRGGHATTFDPNFYGWHPGGWSCLMSQASGRCGPGPFVAYYNAVCDGTGGDATPLANWRAAASAANPAVAKLYIPPGCILAIAGESFSCDFSTGAHIVRNAIIWAYGATSLGTGNSNIQIGCRAFFEDNAHAATISTANAGDTTVTLNGTIGSIGIFSVGRWITVSANAGQSFGFPVTHQVHEKKLITAIVGNTITLSSPLTNTYLSTYPQMDAGSAFNANQGGPATIYLMEDGYDINTTYLGLTLTGDGGQRNVWGRTTVLQDMIFDGSSGLGPSAGGAFWMIGGRTRTMEIDKHNDFFALVGIKQVGSSGIVSVQSSSTLPPLIQNSFLEGRLSGTGQNMVIENTTINDVLQYGVTCCGLANSLTLNKVTYGTAQRAPQFISKSSFSYSSGTFTISLTNYKAQAFPGMWVPGNKYYFGDSSGQFDCGVTFTLNSLSESGGVVSLGTDLTGPLPTPTCSNEGNIAYSTYGAYSLQSFSQKFSSTAGTAVPNFSGAIAP